MNLTPCTSLQQAVCGCGIGAAKFTHLDSVCALGAHDRIECRTEMNGILMVPVETSCCSAVTVTVSDGGGNEGRT